MDASLQFDWLSPYTLPRDLPAFVGRSADIDALDRLVSDGARFVTLTGPAGIGKTRLAIEWASSHLAPGARAAFLPASHLQDAAFVATMIATVGAVDSWPDLPLDRLPPDLDLLIVIDGVDHVDNLAPVLEAALQRCPNLRFVTTSRHPLGSNGVLELPIGPMAEDGARLLLARSGRDLGDEHEAKAVAQQLGGNPLAIELVAPYLAQGASLEGLIGEQQQVALTEVIAWAIAQLTAAEQVVLRRIAVLPAAVSESDLRAAAAKRPAVDPLPDSAVRALAQSGLLYGAPGTGVRMPVAVRAVALAQLDRTEDVSEVRLEFARHLLHRAAEMRLLLAGAERERALRWFEESDPSLQMALSTFVERHRIVMARQLLAACWPYWVIRDRLRDGRAWLDYTIVRTAGQDSDGVERELLFASGLLELLSGNQTAAHLRLTGASQPGCPRAQERWQRAALGGLGVYRVQQEEPENAISLCELYLDSSSGRRNRALARSSLLRNITQLALSSAHVQLMQWDDANVHADFVYSRAATLSDTFMQSAARINQAAVALAKGEWQTAFAALEECVRMQLPRPQAGILAAALVGLARIAVEHSAYELASRLLVGARGVSVAGAPLPPYIVPISCAAVAAQLPASFAVGPRPAGSIADVAALINEALVAIPRAMNPVEAPPQPSKKGISALTTRELEVLCLVAEDKTDQAIAELLFISPRTVSDHISHIIRKLDVYSRTGAVVRALIEKWCD